MTRDEFSLFLKGLKNVQEKGGDADACSGRTRASEH